jgi:hypothetical protein
MALVRTPSDQNARKSRPDNTTDCSVNAVEMTENG